jgi:ABC-2 type transport system permease protein
MNTNATLAVSHKLGGRVRENFIGFNTIVARELKRVLRIWVQTLVPPAITMTLYFIIFGSLIGRRVGQMGGYDYMAYIAPGLIMMQVITNSYANVVSSFFGAKFGRHIEELLVSPLPNSYIVLGYITGGVLRGLLVGGLVTVIALFFTKLHIAHPLVTLSVVLFTAVAFSLGGLINAVYAKKFDDVTIIPTFVLTPLTYLGGVFYSINMLPPAWQAVSRANPILYMVNAFRYGILGVSDIPILYAYGIIVLSMVALYVFSLYLLDKGVGMRT